MDKKILIITGDNLGLGNDQIGYDDIEILKFPVIIADKEYRESEEYTANYLIDLFKREKVSAHTQAIVKGDLIDAIEKNKNSYDIIVHLIMSSTMSAATFQMAESVKKQYESVIPIININSKQVSSGVGVILLRLVDLIKENKKMEEIENEINFIIKNTFSFFALPDLGFLYRGGRIGKAKSFLGSIVKIIPVVGLFGDDPESIIVPIGKGRTHKSANEIIVNNIKRKMIQVEAESVKLVNLISFEEGNEKVIEDLNNQLKEQIKFDRMVIGKPRLAEAIHTGPGSWGASFVLK